MNQTNVSTGQSLVDVALQELGHVEALFDLADANGLSLTEALTPGTKLVIPASAAALPDVASYFTGLAYRVNTGAGAITPVATAQRYFSSLFFGPDTYA